jgi:hypothetical protein
VIFVPLWGNCKINLQEAPDGSSFAVIDSNCVDDHSSLFQLPVPNTTDTELAYSVWVRALAGKGSANLQSCYIDTSTGYTYCNTGTELVVSLKKVTPPKFTDVSKQLLQVCVNGNLEPLFSNSTYQYLWYYQDTGLRLAQLRFYPISTTAIGGSCTSTTTTLS